MERKTVDFGIDLGTTNSAVALLKGVKPEVIKNNDNNDITPSAVYIDKRGQVQVGFRAKGRMETPPTFDDVYTEFKRRMGSDHEYAFKSSGRRMSPEELSAEVLKTLRGDVQQRCGENPTAAVITIPASFEQKQCAATKRAGELAGFTQCPLLQEPVAAALAYGFQAEVSKEYWLVFDFGGGTFDAAVMKAEDGDIHIVNHGGDNFLGGADLDWAILDNLVIPQLRKSYNLPDFKRGNARWRAEIAKVKRAIEEAKILLSRSESEHLENWEFVDAEGTPVVADIQIKRSDLETLIEPIIMRAVEKCQRVLDEKNLSTDALAKTILVGGPTLAPYFREILKSHLGVIPDFSVDPLTVVAQGAAVFAGTQRINRNTRAKATTGQFDVTLNYNPIGPDDDPKVAGEVTVPGGGDLAGYNIEFVNRGSNWRSGRIPLREGGTFNTRILATKGDENIFDILLTDASGNRQKTVPSEIGYRIGTTVKAQIVTNSLSISLADNTTAMMVAKGTEYPFAVTNRLFKTVKDVTKGREENISIPVVEGENEKADCNVKLGELIIPGTKVKRDLPKESEVEVELKAEDPGSLIVTAYIPFLDQDFEATISYARKTIGEDELKKERDKESGRLEELQRRCDETGTSVPDALAKAEGVLAAVEHLIGAAGDGAAANQALHRILEVRAILDEVEDALEWPSTVEASRNAVLEMDRLVAAHGNETQRMRAKELKVHAEQLCNENNKHTELLRRHVEKIAALRREIIFAQKGFWIEFFGDLEKQQGMMRDAGQAQTLLNQGRQYIQKNNIDGLRNVVIRLLELLPEVEAEAIQRGHGGGLVIHKWK
jgi:molecular chaperone DnaK